MGHRVILPLLECEILLFVLGVGGPYLRIFHKICAWPVASADEPSLGPRGRLAGIPQMQEQSARNSKATAILITRPNQVRDDAEFGNSATRLSVRVG